ncbi:50S ribosomal protein L34, chloroplastic [Canna indica]|uniref:Large ribosomal subunit protein bL34c n=1 Tax=Canna indica TaxID=4628 RepID=A0AAQ3JT17_9LILI|nr:50S ribosomal protein L34, chloroplastic [Canna indica]
MSIAALPTASLSFLAGCRGLGRSSLALNKTLSPRSASLLRTSFLSSPSASLSFTSASSFSGLSLCIDFGCNRVVKEGYRGLQVRAGKAALCMTKRSRSRKSLARTHGFRRRMRTTSGRAVIRRRRAKGRKVLCTKSNPNSGKRA